MTAEELFELLSPTALMEIILDLDDADGERTQDEIVLLNFARLNIKAMIGTVGYWRIHEHVLRSRRDARSTVY